MAESARSYFYVTRTGSIGKNQEFQSKNFLARKYNEICRIADSVLFTLHLPRIGRNYDIGAVMCTSIEKINALNSTSTSQPTSGLTKS